MLSVITDHLYLSSSGKIDRVYTLGVAAASADVLISP